MASAQPSLTMRGSAGLGIIAAGGLVGAVVGFLVTSPDLSQREGSPPPEGAGAPVGSGARATGSRATDAEGLTIQTFDDLRIDAGLPAPWIVSGGGSATAVALPTSVDRSVRLRTSDGGEPAMACLPLTAGALDITHLALDVLPGPLPPGQLVVVTIRAGRTDVLRLGPDPTGRWTNGTVPTPIRSAQPGPTGLPGDDPWVHLAVDLDPARELVEWSATRGEATIGSGRLPATLAAQVPDALCISSPGAAPSSWVAINNVEITA